MPYITIESGALSDEQKEQLIKRLTEVSSEIMNVPQEFFVTTIKELPDKKEAIEIIKNLKVEVAKLNLNLEIGTEDVIITSGIIAVLSSVLGIVLAQTIKKYDREKHKYEIYPVYQNKNLINLYLNCIIKVKMVHIIYIIYVLVKKRRVNKYERTSNRRTYDYSYE